jgi:hypothetical protein
MQSIGAAVGKTIGRMMGLPRVSIAKTLVAETASSGKHPPFVLDLSLAVNPLQSAMKGVGKTTAGKGALTGLPDASKPR